MNTTLQNTINNIVNAVEFGLTVPLENNMLVAGIRVPVSDEELRLRRLQQKFEREKFVVDL